MTRTLKGYSAYVVGNAIPDTYTQLKYPLFYDPLFVNKYINAKPIVRWGRKVADPVSRKAGLPRVTSVRVTLGSPAFLLLAA